MEHRALGIGIIGAGHIIRRHALAYRSLPQLARLLAVADLDGKRARAARQRFGFEADFDDYRAILGRDDIAAVSVCTPAGTHARIVIDALEAGKHVLCEKPLATTLADADEIIAVADRHPGQIVCCVFQLRSDPTHRRMRWMIREKHIGSALAARMCVRLCKSPAYYANVPGRGSWETDGGGVVINQAIHQLDALVSFLGDPLEVSAVMDTFVQPIEAEDTLAGWIRFRSGAIATVECTTCAKSKEFSIDVFGDSAGVCVSGDPDSQKFDWRVRARGSAAKKALTSMGLKAFPSPPDPKSLSLKIKKLIAKIGRREWLPPPHWGHTPFVREFLEAALAGEAGPVPPREARRSLELAMALYQSAKTGSAVKLALDSRSPLHHGVELPPDGEDGKEAETLARGPTAERSTFRLGNKEQVRT